MSVLVQLYNESLYEYCTIVELPKLSHFKTKLTNFVADEAHYKNVQVAAYYCSLKNPTWSETDCWLEGEREMNARYIFI